MTGDPFVDDPWISKTSPIGPKRLHALGLTQLRWNICEFGLFNVFCEAVKLPRPECWALAHGLGDVALVERIMAVAKLRRWPAPIATRASEVLSYYDICRQNRNFLVHAWFSEDHDPEAATLTRKSKKIDEMEAEPFKSDLETIRRVADELTDLSGYLFFLEVMLAEGIEPQMPSLGKLKMPDLLWKPRPPDRKAQPLPPEPSQA
jgi:hypothetical protein